MEITLKQFIEILILEIKWMQDSGKHYFTFGIITQGIELLGACLDNKSLHVEGESGKRFRHAIDQLFPVSYKQFNNSNSKFDLYKNLRCGLLHVAIPQSPIELIQESEKNHFNAKHLEIINIRGMDRLVLVSQDLFTDFETASKNLIRQMESGSGTLNKIENSIISTEP